jgi:hypothetical protein
MVDLLFGLRFKISIGDQVISAGAERFMRPDLILGWKPERHG